MNHSYVFYVIMYIIIIYNSIGESRPTYLRAFYWFCVSILYFGHGLRFRKNKDPPYICESYFLWFCYGLRFRKNEDLGLRSLVFVFVGLRFRNTRQSCYENSRKIARNVFGQEKVPKRPQNVANSLVYSSFFTTIVYLVKVVYLKPKISHLHNILGKSLIYITLTTILGKIIPIGILNPLIGKI